LEIRRLPSVRTINGDFARNGRFGVLCQSARPGGRYAREKQYEPKVRKPNAREGLAREFFEGSRARVRAQVLAGPWEGGLKVHWPPCLQPIANVCLHRREMGTGGKGF